jgi:pimeloyl-ACP methyl ester carboxylesterase
MDARFTPAHRGGAGPPLVLLHGFTGSWRVWELVLPALVQEGLEVGRLYAGSLTAAGQLGARHFQGAAHERRDGDVEHNEHVLVGLLLGVVCVKGCRVAEAEGWLSIGQ